MVKKTEDEVAKVEPLKRVKVVAPFRVVYDGIAYSGSDVPEVPADVADSWLRNMWVTEA
jgi:hypothetical protein